MLKKLFIIFTILLLPLNAYGWGIFPTSFFDKFSCVSGNDTDTVLLIHSNTTDGSTTFVDSSNGITDHTGDITVNGNTHHERDYIFPGFGTSSIYFDGIGDYLSIADSADWDFGTGDFCVEFKWNFGSSLGNNGFIGRYVGFDNYVWGIAFEPNNLIWYHGGLTWQNAWTPATNTVYHIAFARSSGTLNLFINGVLTGTTTDGDNYNTNTSLSIGSFASGGDPGTFCTGYMTEIAIHKGDAVYPIVGFSPNRGPYCD